MTDSSSLAFLPGLEVVAETALLHEAIGKRGALSHIIKPVYPDAHFIGRALTIKSAPGDNLMLHVAVAAAQPGDVIVASVDGFLEAGIWGDLITVAAQVRGVRGLVTDGAVRARERTPRDHPLDFDAREKSQRAQDRDRTRPTPQNHPPPRRLPRTHRLSPAQGKCKRRARRAFERYSKRPLQSWPSEA